MNRTNCVYKFQYIKKQKETINKIVGGIVTSMLVLSMFAVVGASSAPGPALGTAENVISMQPPPNYEVGHEKDHIIGIIGLIISIILILLAMLKIRKNNFLRAGTILLILSFAPYMLFLATAEGDYGFIGALFAAPIIFAASMILILIGSGKKEEIK